MNEWVNECKDELMHQRMSEWRKDAEWMYESMNEVMND